MSFQLPPRYIRERLPGGAVVARDDLLGFVRHAIQDSGSLYEYAARTAEPITLLGRGAAFVMAVPDHLAPSAERPRWVVRHYHRGGALARALGDRYLRVGTARPFHELRMSVEVRTRGVPTPEVLAAAVYRAGPFYRGEIATRYLSGTRDLADALFGEHALQGEARARVLEGAGRTVRLLHERGVVHADLNIKNLIVDTAAEPPRLHVLDLDRARLVKRMDADDRERMLERLERSLAKWERHSGTTLDPLERAALYRGYEVAPP